MSYPTNIVVASYLLALGVPGLQPAWSQQDTSSKPRPLAEVRPILVVANEEPVVLTQWVVLEVEPSERATEIIKRIFPSINDDGIAFDLGHTDAAKTDLLFRSLVDDGLADVISRPQIMTVAGKKGVVQVGQQIKLPPTKDPNDKETPRTIAIK